MTAKEKALDNLDWKILTELQKNARVSASEIGRRVGLTAPAVAKRIARMEESGFILGYRTTMDYDKLGLSVRVFLQFKSTSLKHDDMVKVVDAMPQIQEWYTVTGENCMLLKVAVATTKDLEIILAQLGKYGGTNTSIILSGNVKPRIVGKNRN
ncbi:MAG TPA: Lrp/AsnC family transcriptional regulator [Cyclobacteriaceae bacterium]|nr:Lrp/AsnC family transcriptional regulator [Cyclobacteriaceae bacterium]